MPCHCCVPQCSKRGYREEDGTKVSYFTFPSEETQKKKWTYAIRRDPGVNFQLTKSTVVCSLHFRESDIKKTLAGKHLLKPGVVPSVFPWIRTSPRKRKPPIERSCSSQSTGCIKDNESNDIGIDIIVEEQDIEMLEGVQVSLLDVATQTDFSEHEVHLAEVIARCERKIQTLEIKIEDLQSLQQDTERRNESLKNKLFTLDSLESNNLAAAFYTGFQNWDAFMSNYRYLSPGENGENINYWLSGNTSISVDYEDDSDEIGMNKRGRARALKPLDEYFLVMCRLRQGFHEEHLAHLFNISLPTVSRIFITWINFMYLKLGEINIWPSREVIDATMPEVFKKKYISTRVIIDCTEIKCQMPSSLQLNGELFSSYKHHTTLKGLVGISPGGAMTFISQLYTGSISDREIVTRCGFLELPFQDNDSVMADKGFTIQDLLPLGVSLNLPPFLGGSSQMPAEDVVKTQEIASLRIHIERAINKIKNFHIWDKVIPLHQFGVVNQMWAVCAILCNAQPNIISV